MAPKLHDQAHKAQLPIYIGAVLDDYGLTPTQFRLYGHIARRGQCWAKIETIAQVCRISKNTVRGNLKFLVSQGLIEKATRTGLTNVYEVKPESQWKPNPNQRRVGVATAPTRQEATPTDGWEDTPTKRQEGNPYQNTVDKGTPLEGTPPEGTPKETGCWRTPVFPEKQNAKLKRRPRFLAEVLKFALTHAQCPGKVVDKWLTPNLKRILDQPASVTIGEQQGNEDARDALERAFRFIYYNNGKGWQLTDSWQAAYVGFADKASYGCGPADVPVDWIPYVEGEDGFATG